MRKYAGETGEVETSVGKRLLWWRRGSKSGRGARVVFGEARSPDFPHFVDRKDDLDSYLLRLERHATVAKWSQANWLTQLSALLGGKALDIVYFRLLQEDVLDYGRLKVL